MTEDYSSICFESYDRILNDSGMKFFDEFYRLFLSATPEVASLFSHTDMQRQKTVLRLSFYQLIHFYEKKVPSESMAALGKVHAKDGRNIPPHLYDIWLNCLINAVKNYDPQFSPHVETAWRMVFSPGIDYMKHMYEL